MLDKRLVGVTFCFMLSAFAVPAFCLEGIAYYDPGSGNVTVDVSMATENLTSIGLQWRSPGTDRFRSSEFIPPPGSSEWTMIDDWAVFAFGDVLSPQIEPGVYDLGDILPSQLDNSQAESYFQVWTSTAPSTSPFSSWTTEVDNTVHSLRLVYGDSSVPPPDNSGAAPPPAIEWAESANVIYEQETGTILFDSSITGGGEIAGFRVRASRDFQTSEFQGFIDGETRLESRLIEQQGNRIDAGSNAIGNILPAHLSPQELENAITEAIVFGPMDLLTSLDGGFSRPSRDRFAATTFFQPASNRPHAHPGDTKDVNDDGAISPTDALLIINGLNDGRSGELDDRANPSVFVDVNADGNLSPIDAILVINALNDQSQAPLSAIAVPEPDGSALAVITITALLLISRKRLQ